MGFLDNLENSLKSLESQEERDPGASEKRAEERVRALAAAPWADRLKNSSYTKNLFDEAALAGHKARTKVYMAWVDTTLRLEAKGRVLELRPTSEGIVSEYVDASGKTISETVDLNGSPGGLVQRWLGAGI